jgi:hypothetical protein
MQPRAEILQRLDAERRSLVRRGEVLERLPDVTRLQIGDQHLISWSSLNDANADAVIAREIAHFRGMATPFEWKAYAHDAPHDLVQRLARRGLMVGDCEAVMIFDLAEPASWMSESGGCRVECIVRQEQLDDFRRVLVDVDGEANKAIVAELSTALAERSTEQQGYIAYVDNEPASVGRLYTHPQSAFGGLYGGSTSTEFRGRGLYRATVAARARDAQRSGAKYLLVDALPTSRPILERLGFVHLSDTWPCTFVP